MWLISNFRFKTYQSPGILSLKNKIHEKNIFQVTRKIIRRYVSSDGTEKEEVTMQGTAQGPISIEEGDGYSKVMKRIVLKSDTEQSEVRSPDSLT